jgi:hypothetical protein
VGSNPTPSAIVVSLAENVRPMTLNLSIDEELAQGARQVAESRGMSLDQLIRQYLEDLTDLPSAEAEIAEFRRLSGQGSSQGWRFNRDEIHERS